MSHVRMQAAGAASGYLLETLVQSCAGAQAGGGIFAFASADGAGLLVEDEAFQAFAHDAPFELVVGLDAITDTRAVEVLLSAEDALAGFSVLGFLHDRRGVLFHPKVCWFDRPEGVIALVGSGNLTLGGLRGNWEAFSVATLAPPDSADFHDRVRQWRDDAGDYLLPLDDPGVAERAARNQRANEAIRRRRHRSPEELLAETAAAAGAEEDRSPLGADTPVLVAEIPAAGGRWNQANFDLASYEGFFGARVGTRRRIVLRHANDDATLGEIESRPSVAVRSRNFRFELAAARGVTYPADGRPVSVFVKLSNGTFVYRLVMPADDAYAELAGFLSATWEGREDRMRRVRTTVGRLRDAWPTAPLWRAAEEALAS